MPQAIHQVDAFTDRPFAGNPAAVCIQDGAAPERWMRDLAREMNLSETAFLHPEGDGWRLRWFTPTVEVDLCGHATLASAHVLWETGQVASDARLKFHTRSGELGAVRRGAWIELDFPAKFAEASAPPAGLLDALGVRATHVSRSVFDWMVEVESAEIVRAAKPDFTALKRVEARGIILTAPSDTREFDFISRFFAPGSGIDEDPVTGSAHCTLTPHWSKKLGKTEMTAYQASERGGVVKVALAGSRVKLGGQAVTVMRGVLAQDP